MSFSRSFSRNFPKDFLRKDNSKSFFYRNSKNLSEIRLEILLGYFFRKSDISSGTLSEPFIGNSPEVPSGTFRQATSQKIHLAVRVENISESIYGISEGATVLHIQWLSEECLHDFCLLLPDSILEI